MVVFAACSGQGSTQALTPPPGTAVAAAPLALDDSLRAVVPPGWAVADWAASSDGQYVVLEEASFGASPTTPRSNDTSAATLNVFKRQPNGDLIDAARFIGQCCLTPRAATFAHDAQVLSPDASGVRHLTVHWEDQRGLTTGGGYPDSHVSIAPDGSVTTDETTAGVAGNPPRVQTAIGSVPGNPGQLITATSQPRFPSTPAPSPAAPVTAPAGAVPAGWRILQSVASPDGTTFAVVTDSTIAYGAADQLSVYQVRDGHLVERWRVVNAFIDLDTALTFHDINGDGHPEVVYNSANGSNGWTTGGTFAATVMPDGTVQDVHFSLPIAKSAPGKPVDLNGDGVYEWTAVDASWELQQAFCHACSPSSEFILAWNGTEYADASAKFGAAIIATRSDPAPPPPSAPCQTQDDYLSAMVGRYLDYWNAGRKADAVRIEDQMRAFPLDPGLVAKRDAIVQALAYDPHYPSIPVTVPSC